jgi:hypothetical protein
LADGAGGNRNIGIDPQKFSRSLLGYCVEIIKSEAVMPNQMAKLACKSIHILESQQIDGLCLLFIFQFQSNIINVSIKFPLFSFKKKLFNGFLFYFFKHFTQN